MTMPATHKAMKRKRIAAKPKGCPDCKSHLIKILALACENERLELSRSEFITNYCYKANLLDQANWMLDVLAKALQAANYEIERLVMNNERYRNAWSKGQEEPTPDRTDHLDLKHWGCATVREIDFNDEKGQAVTMPASGPKQEATDAANQKEKP